MSWRGKIAYLCRVYLSSIHWMCKCTCYWRCQNLVQQVDCCCLLQWCTVCKN